MSEYISRGKELLKILINNGFEAYFIGEAVRNSILKKPVDSIDITTSAHINMVKGILNHCEFEDINENSVKLHYGGFVFNVQTFTLSEGADNNTFLSKHYSKSLLDDLANRDYTINAIAMSHSGKLTDAYNGYNDILKKRISHIGNAKIRFYKDPSLMIKAFALISELNYKLTSRTKKAITKRRKYLDKCDVSTYYEDLKKVFDGKYAKKALIMMDKTNIERCIPSLRKVIRKLSGRYKKVSLEEALLMAFVSNGKIDDKYIGCIENYAQFVTVFTLACANKKCKYDPMTLYGNGLEVCLKANRINHLLGKCRKKDRKIKKQYEALPIKKPCDLEYKGQDIMKIIHESEFPKISDILDDVIMAILNGEINNNRNEIERLVLTLLRKYNILYDINGLNNPDDYMIKEEQFEEFNIPKERIEIEREDEELLDDLTNHRLDMLEQKFEEQSRLLKEKELKLQEMEDLRLRNDVDVVVNKSVDYINTNDGLRYMIKDPDNFKEELHNFIFNYVKEEGDQ